MTVDVPDAFMNLIKQSYRKDDCYVCLILGV